MGISSTRPPHDSCQPVKGTSPTGRPHFLVSTVPKAMDVPDARPATTPTASYAAPGVRTNIATPASPNNAASHVRGRLGSRRMSTASSATMSGLIAPNVADTPPGNRYAETNSNEKNAPKLSTPSTSDRHHHSPRGSVRVKATISRPAGRARATAASSGRSGGSNSVVVRYVVPHSNGARAVAAIRRMRLMRVMGTPVS